ncbi:hypothetical protein Athai_46990 [Actinocatenispora thailandica]|uniref:Phage tail protein n=1 Tax=Actinocatenispora thailandica TaxID=227318 RepID=A0A7R7DSZ1_9ACTN|nr:phage tail protein I [Actinocatenispora thailandica]BCJ37196.1 hypothetical protein Athai_46990 [Actinocatenispora thailandica]
MRGTVPGLTTPYPLRAFLPSIYQDDDFTMRWVSAFDEVIAPAALSLECLESYLDPRLAPPDFLHWLADWVGAVTDETWDDRTQRDAVLAAVRIHRCRGTVAGLRMLLETATGGRVEIVDTGGVHVSSIPGAEVPEPGGRLSIRVTLADPDSVSVPLLDALVRGAKPAHVLHELELRRDDHLHPMR